MLTLPLLTARFEDCLHLGTHPTTIALYLIVDISGLIVLVLHQELRECSAIELDHVSHTTNANVQIKSIWSVDVEVVRKMVKIVVGNLTPETGGDFNPPFHQKITDIQVKFLLTITGLSIAPIVPATICTGRNWARRFVGYSGGNFYILIV